MHQTETEQLIGDAVIEKFGYSKKPHANDSRKRVVSVEGFQSLQVKQPTNIMANQIQELEREIYEANNRDRLLNIDYGKYVRDRIREYNYIVTYKHLKEKDSQETREIMKMMPKSPQEIIFEQIDNVKKELQDKNNQTLSKQYELNKNLNDLFRQFRKMGRSGGHRKVTDSIGSRERSNTAVNNQTTDSLRFKEHSFAGRNSGLSAFSVTAAPKSGRLHFVFKRDRAKPSALLEPFPVKSFYDESKKVETKIKQEQEVLDLWRMKVSEHRDIVKSRIHMQEELLRQRQRSNASPQLSRRNSRNDSYRRSPDPANQLLMHQQSRINESEFQVERNDVEDISQRNKHRKSILSTIIKKRSSRYVRYKGMKGLMPFDSNQAAEYLLEGRASDLRKSNAEVQQEEVVQQYVDTDLYELPVLEGPPKRLQNTSDYDAEYKNEKINLSLKTKKR